MRPVTPICSSFPVFPFMSHNQVKVSENTFFFFFFYKNTADMMHVLKPSTCYYQTVDDKLRGLLLVGCYKRKERLRVRSSGLSFLKYVYDAKAILTELSEAFLLFFSQPWLAVSLCLCCTATFTLVGRDKPILIYLGSVLVNQSVKNSCLAKLSWQYAKTELFPVLSPTVV